MENNKCTYKYFNNMYWLLKIVLRKVLFTILSLVSYKLFGVDFKRVVEPFISYLDEPFSRHNCQILPKSSFWGNFFLAIGVIGFFSFFVIKGWSIYLDNYNNMALESARAAFMLHVGMLNPLYYLENFYFINDAMVGFRNHMEHASPLTSAFYANFRLELLELLQAQMNLSDISPELLKQYKFCYDYISALGLEEWTEYCNKFYFDYNNIEHHNALRKFLFNSVRFPNNRFPRIRFEE